MLVKPLSTGASVNPLFHTQRVGAFLTNHSNPNIHIPFSAYSLGVGRTRYRGIFLVTNKVPSISGQVYAL